MSHTKQLSFIMKNKLIATMVLTCFAGLAQAQNDLASGSHVQKVTAISRVLGDGRKVETVADGAFSQTKHLDYFVRRRRLVQYTTRPGRRVVAQYGQRSDRGHMGHDIAARPALRLGQRYARKWQSSVVHPPHRRQSSRHLVCGLRHRGRARLAV